MGPGTQNMGVVVDGKRYVTIDQQQFVQKADKAKARGAVNRMFSVKEAPPQNVLNAAKNEAYAISKKDHLDTVDIQRILTKDESVTQMQDGLNSLPIKRRKEIHEILKDGETQDIIDGKRKAGDHITSLDLSKYIINSDKTNDVEKLWALDLTNAVHAEQQVKNDKGTQLVQQPVAQQTYLNLINPNTKEYKQKTNDSGNWQLTGAASDDLPENHGMSSLLPLLANGGQLSGTAGIMMNIDQAHKTATLNKMLGNIEQRDGSYQYPYNLFSNESYNSSSGLLPFMNQIIQQRQQQQQQQMIMFMLIMMMSGGGF